MRNHAEILMDILAAMADFVQEPILGIAYSELYQAAGGAFIDMSSIFENLEPLKEPLEKLRQLSPADGEMMELLIKRVAAEPTLEDE